MESNLLDISGPSEPSPTLPPLRAWRVYRQQFDNILGTNRQTNFVVQAHQLNPDGEMLQFVTYVLAGYEAVGQITRLIAKGAWYDVETIAVQPEGTSVQ